MVDPGHTPDDTEAKVLPGVGVPVHGSGGVQVYVNPEVGLTVDDTVIVLVLAVPAAEADQLVVDVRLE